MQQNMGGLGPQMSMPGQFQQPMNMGGFPPMQDPPRQEESKAQPSGMSLGASSFSIGANAMESKEFIPAGMMVKTESEFPDLGDALGDEPPKKKKGGGKKGKGPQKVVAKKAEEEVDTTTAWKGKPSTFFVMK